MYTHTVLIRRASLQLSPHRLRASALTPQASLVREIAKCLRVIPLPSTRHCSPAAGPAPKSAVNRRTCEAKISRTVAAGRPASTIVARMLARQSMSSSSTLVSSSLTAETGPD